MLIRTERPGDAEAISIATNAAFAPRQFDEAMLARIAEARLATGITDEDASHGLSEADVVDALRSDGALALSLVGEIDGEVIAHIAFSPMQIGSDKRKWFQLGPVSVIPERQRVGHGSALIREGLRRLQKMGAAGCVLLGYPPYYARFGFELDRRLTHGGNPNPALQRLTFAGPPPQGEIRMHWAFDEG